MRAIPNGHVLPGLPRPRSRGRTGDLSIPGTHALGLLAALLSVALASSGCGDDGLGPDGGGEPRFVAIAAGGDHTCALAEDGAAWCWGSDARGQLGDGAPAGGPRAVPVRVAGAPPFEAVAAGARHSCGLTAQGDAWCWGSDAHGQLGSGGGRAGGLSALPVPVAGGLRFRLLTLGGIHTCGLTPGGKAYCWGSNLFGELGADAAASRSAEPVPVAGGLLFTHLDAGTHHACGIADGGDVHCWGYDRFGQVGPEAPGETCGLSACSRAPVRVTGLPPLDRLDAGGLHTCGLDPAGDAYCWGADLIGELGVGEEGEPAADNEVAGRDGAHPDPVRVTGAPIFASLALGEHHSCGTAGGGEAYCWGSGGYGQVGAGAVQIVHATPAPVAGGHAFASLSAGMLHTCGIIPGGRAYCWGDNRSAQLGDGTTTQRDRPVPVRMP